MEIKTVVYQRDKRRFDIAGQALPFNLKETDECIRPGLAQRLLTYAAKRMTNLGFANMLDCEVYVETSDADLNPADRTYHVAWVTPEGTEFGIQGIQTNNGWPCLDHGPFIQ